MLRARAQPHPAAAEELAQRRRQASEAMIPKGQVAASPCRISENQCAKTVTSAGMRDSRSSKAPEKLLVQDSAGYSDSYRSPGPCRRHSEPIPKRVERHSAGCPYLRLADREERAMPWTASARRQYARTATRYTTDLTDTEFAFIAPHRPAPGRLGRPRKVDLREVLNAILYLLRQVAPGTSCPRSRRPRARCSAISGAGGRMEPADTARQAGRGRARAGRQGGLADRRHRRQPERA